MKCGETIFVRDINGSNVLRLIAQCHGRFMLISSLADYRNGYLLSDWESACRELVARTVPAKLDVHAMQAESTAGGLYTATKLTYPLSVKGLADLFAVDAADVRALLNDLAVQVTDS